MLGSNREGTTVTESKPSRRVKPVLRGVSHEIAAWVAAPASLALFVAAKSSSARWGAATYGLSLFTLFLVSAIFHRPTWSPRVRLWIGRLDNCAIFLLIAGTYTPICLLLGGWDGHALLAVAWIGAVLGIVLTFAWPLAPKPLMAVIYVMLGWVFVPAAAGLRLAMGGRAVLLLFVGGMVYTAGAVIYALRRPDPFPRVFGYHEIFHLLVIAGAACHFVVVKNAVLGLG
jgi:hemolysin III